MADYLSVMLSSLGTVLSWPGILIPVFGTLLAMVTSFLPGVGSASIMAIMLVLTLDWPVESVLLLFGSLVGGATYMGSVTAILFNVPGGAPSAAALLDGYPLSRRGFTRTALATAATASAVGSVFGVLVLLAILPVLPAVLNQFGPLERLLLGLWGLATITTLPSSPPLKAALMCLLGLLLAMIGIDPIEGTPRWNFGSVQMLTGLDTVPVLLGLFTIAEIISWKDQRLSSTDPVLPHNKDSTWGGVLAVFRHYWLTLRSSVIGTLIGIVPGVGGTVAGFVAYGHASQGGSGDSDDPLDAVPFGEGNIRGLIAPEAAVDAKDGGSLLPAISLGMPGSEAGVFLVTVLTLHGLVPGIPMLDTQLSFTFVLIFALLFSNILTSLVGLGLAPPLAKLGRLPLHYAVFPLLALSLFLMLQLNGRVSDVIVALVFGVAGYWFKLNGWPRIPMVIAFILANLIETNLAVSLRLAELGRLSLLDRPMAIAITFLMVLSLYLIGRRNRALERESRDSGQDVAVASVLALAALLLSVAAIVQDYSAISLVLAAATLLLALGMVAASFKPGWRARQR